MRRNGDDLLQRLFLLEKELAASEIQLSEVRGESSDYSKCISLFQEWVSKIIDQNVNGISDLVSSGLSSVIDDQNIQFKITQELKNNKPIFKVLAVNGGRECDPVEGTGGGVASLISTIIRFTLTAKFGLSRLILLDETLSSLSNAYVPAAAAFLRELCKEFDIDILMVTHNSDFINESDTSYEAINDGKLKLRRVK